MSLVPLPLQRHVLNQKVVTFSSKHKQADLTTITDPVLFHDTPVQPNWPEHEKDETKIKLLPIINE